MWICYCESCLVSTSKGTQNQYFLSEVLTIRRDLSTACMNRKGRMRRTCYPGVCTNPGACSTKQVNLFLYLEHALYTESMVHIFWRNYFSNLHKETTTSTCTQDDEPMISLIPIQIAYRLTFRMFRLLFQALPLLKPLGVTSYLQLSLKPFQPLG